MSQAEFELRIPVLWRFKNRAAATISSICNYFISNPEQA